MIDYKYADLYYEDSVFKQINIETEDGSVITNEDVYSEEMSLSESLCSESSLTFGCCEASCLKLKIANRFSPLYGQWLTVTETLNDNTDEAFLFGSYKVQSDKPAADRSYRDITAYDAMYDIINADGVDVADWYNEILPDYDSTVTLKKFRQSFLQHLGIEEIDASLVNDDMVIEKTIETSSLSGQRVIKAICEINGVFAHITRDGKLEYIQLEPINTDKAFDIPINKSSDYEDFETKVINCLQIREDDSDPGVVYGSGANRYIISGNFLLYGKTTEDLITVTANLYPVINNITYRPATLTVPGNPCIEVGDVVHLSTKYQEIYTYVLKRDLSGIQALTDILTSDGTETYVDDGGSLSEKIEQIKSRTSELASEVKENTESISIAVEMIEADYANFLVLEAEVANIQTLFAEYATIQELEAALARIDELYVDYEEVNNLVVQNLEAVYADIGTLTADLANIETLFANYATIEELQAALAEISELYVDYEEVNTIIAQNLEAVYADIYSLTADLADITKLFANYATVDELTAFEAYISNEYVSNATITELLAGYASIADLQAVYADITLLDADIAHIVTLLGGEAGIGELTTIHLTVNNAIIDEAVVAEALVGTVLADIIQSNIIYTDYITIMSENGGIVIAGTTMQFSDSSGTVRLQLGEDSDGNFTFVLYDETGEGIMIDSEGIHASAVPDGLIVNDMVADNAAIAGSKLDIESVSKYLNDAGLLELDASKVIINGDTLDYQITQITQQIEDIEAMGIETIENYYAIGTADSYPPFEWEDDQLSILGEAILGTMVLGVGTKSSWTTTQPQTGEGEYLWWSQKVTYVDGSIVWTIPALWTDDYLRNAITIQQTELEVIQGQIQGKIWMTDIEDVEDSLTTIISEQYGELTILIDTIDQRVGSLTTTFDEEFETLSAQVTSLTLNLGEISAQVTDVYEKTENAITEGVPYYAVSDSPTSYPDFDAIASEYLLEDYSADETGWTKVIFSSGSGSFSANTEGNYYLLITTSDSGYIGVRRSIADNLEEGTYHIRFEASTEEGYEETARAAYGISSADGSVTVYNMPTGYLSPGKWKEYDQTVTIAETKEGTAYFYLIARDSNIPVLYRNIQIVFDPVTGENAWTTTQPEYKEKQYIWIAYLRTRVNGSTYWTEPTLLTDDYIRKTASTMSERYSELVLNLDSALLQVANIQSELTLNYSTTQETIATIIEYVTESSSEILSEVSNTYTTYSYVDNIFNDLALDNVKSIETYYAVSKSDNSPNAEKIIKEYFNEDFSDGSLPDGWARSSVKNVTFESSDILGSYVRINKSSDSSDDYIRRNAAYIGTLYAGTYKAQFKAATESGFEDIANGKLELSEFSFEYYFSGLSSNKWKNIEIIYDLDEDTATRSGKSTYYYIYSLITNAPILLTDISFYSIETSADWMPERPTVSSGEYLWVRYRVVYADGHEEWTEPFCIPNNDTDEIMGELTELDASLRQYVDDKEATILSTVSGIYATIDGVDATIRENTASILETISETESNILATVSTTLNDYPTTSVMEATIEASASNTESYIMGQVTSKLNDYPTTNDMTATIEAYVNNAIALINLSVVGDLGSKASITLTTSGGSIVQSLDLSKVREAFAEEEDSAVIIESGTVTFVSNTLIIESRSLHLDANGNLEINTNQFTLDSNGAADFSGNLSSPTGTIGGWTIADNGLIVGDTDSMSSTEQGIYIGSSSSSSRGMNIVGKYGYIRMAADTSAITLNYNDGFTNMRGQIYGGDIQLYMYDDDDPTGHIELNGGLFSWLYDNRCWFILYNTQQAIYIPQTVTDLGGWKITEDSILGLYLSGKTSDTWLDINNQYKRIYANGSYLTGSDENLKHDIEPFSANNDAKKYDTFFDNISPVSYELDSDKNNKTHYGFTYQELVESLELAGIDPETTGLVDKVIKDKETGETVGAIAYMELIPLLVYEVQKLKEQLENYKTINS